MALCESAFHPWGEILEENNLKEKRLNLTQFQKFQSVVSWLHGFLVCGNAKTSLLKDQRVQEAETEERVTENKI